MGLRKMSERVSSNLEWPEFDYRRLPLSPDSRRQLGGIYESVRSRGVPASKNAFRVLVARHLYDHQFGHYIPLSNKTDLFRKSPVFSKSVIIESSGFQHGPSLPFFTNSLLIPLGYEEDSFRLADAPKPILRVANSGFLVVTIEIDCKRRADFEEHLRWTRGGVSSVAPFAAVDDGLCQFTDYRGYTIVLSGNRSVHFHFLFSTRHLEHSAAGATASERWGEAQPRQSALMAKAHNLAWDRVERIFSDALGCHGCVDRKLRGVTQWRRTPWGVRKLEKDSEILELRAGTVVTQLVLDENIRSRAPADAKEFCVPGSLSLADPISPKGRPSMCSIGVGGASAPMIQELQEMCQSAWGPFPQPVSMERQDGEWLLKFRNGPDDRNPSTFVLGAHQRLVLNGRHDFKLDFFLPEGLSAQELGDLLALSHGAPSPAPVMVVSAETEARWPCPARTLEHLRLRSGVSLLEMIRRDAISCFPEPITEHLSELKDRYRRKMLSVIAHIRALGPRRMLVVSGEGVGKTSAHLRIFCEEVLYQRRLTRFIGFAFRTRAQAEEKAAEFGEHVRTVLVRPFWEHLEDACREVGRAPIVKDEFDELDLSLILGDIRRQAPDVFDALEARRKELWSASAFDASSTVLVMTHKSAEHWVRSTLTRAWHHPEFDPAADKDAQHRLAGAFQLGEIVFDDPEADEFVHVIPESLHAFLRRQQDRCPDWRGMTLPDRRTVYQALEAGCEIPGVLIKNFDDFDEFMRMDLARLRPFDVDFDRIPFGQDNPGAKRGIYRGKHGDRYFLGAKAWLGEMRARPTFLTTEVAIANVIETALAEVNAMTGHTARSEAPLTRLDFDRLPGIYPIDVPVYLDPRARSDSSGEASVSDLAREIHAADPEAVIISDGVRDAVPNVYTFQSIKGLNGLENRNLYIILAWAAPPKYAELNVIGQWLEDDEIIANHYQDQINQAVGRNRGFRDKNTGAKTVVVASKGLWVRLLSRLQEREPRTRLYVAREHPWAVVAPGAEAA